MLSLILPKNERKNSFLLLCDLFSFVFWKKLKTPIKHFEIIWPLTWHKCCHIMTITTRKVAFFQKVSTDAFVIYSNIWHFKANFSHQNFQFQESLGIWQIHQYFLKKKLPWTEMMKQLLSILSYFAHPRRLKDFSVLFISTPRSFEEILFLVFVIKFELFCKFHKRNNFYQCIYAKGQ